MNRWRGLHPETRRRAWRWARRSAGAAILVMLALRLGADPFLDGVRRVDAASLTTATAITAVTTVVAAWRWRLIARGLGLHLPLGDAVASYYRSQFLNSVLPGGVAGDVHRGVRHGSDAGDLWLGVRSVGWDRAAGQAVQIALAVGTLLVLVPPVRSVLVAVIVVGLCAAVVSAAVLRALRRGRSRASRLLRTVADDARAAFLSTQAWPAVLLASVAVVIGHVGVFVVAATADGSAVPLRHLVPLALLVLLAMTVPISVGGWGPREGAAAWVFALAGLGAARGVETATTYGVLSFVATLPGLAALLLAHRPRVTPRVTATAEGSPAAAH